MSEDVVDNAPQEVEPGWSNGVPAPEREPVVQNHDYEPGWSNRGAVLAEDAKTVGEAETKVVEPEQVEDKAVRPAKKAAAKKTTAKKG